MNRWKSVVLCSCFFPNSSSIRILVNSSSFKHSFLNFSSVQFAKIWVELKKFHLGFAFWRLHWVDILVLQVKLGLYSSPIRNHRETIVCNYIKIEWLGVDWLVDSVAYMIKLIGYNGVIQNVVFTDPFMASRFFVMVFFFLISCIYF